ncbi:hypothetical protein Peur_060111 [Populus x canadensis]
MKRWFSDITLNVILKIIVSKRYVDYASRGEEKPSHEWGDSIRTFLELAGMFVVSDALPFLRWLDLGGVEKAMKRTSKNIDRSVEKWLEEHKQKKASGTAKGEEDFMDLMLSDLQDLKQEIKKGQSYVYMLAKLSSHIKRTITMHDNSSINSTSSAEKHN